MSNSKKPNAKGNRNGRGPPPWAGNGRHVERDGDAVAVGRRPREDARDRVAAATSQIDRVEAKLDVLLSILDDGGRP